MCSARRYGKSLLLYLLPLNLTIYQDSKRYLVVDTNILLSHLDALQDFVEDVQHLHLSQDVAVLIPGAVIGELDGYVPCLLEFFGSCFNLHTKTEESRRTCLVRPSRLRLDPPQSTRTRRG